MTWWDQKKKEVYEKNLFKNKSLFVVDEPSDEDNFGFDHYINTLEALVRECQTPFVVGLLGKWGVGKTTLVNKFLKKRLAETPGIGFVYFDAWKYQKDAFYRQFLKQMKEDLSINDDTLPVRLYKTIKRTRQSGDLEWNVEEIKNLIFELIAWYIGWYIFAVQFQWTPRSLITFLAPLIPALILGLAHRATKLIQIKKFDEEDKPLFSNEQFEDVFRQYVKKASEIGKKRIVVTIDNLDRCTNETAIELLGTIKTFLNVEGCVYLVPVDEEALINHLKEGLLNDELTIPEKDKQSREFLKKFFQATVRLSPFIRGDLEKYIDKIASNVVIPYKDDTEKENVASLVLTAYSHTPRKIKQFYNNLSASYLLALAQEEQENLDKGFITGNLSFLAKLIILQEEWPKFFGIIKKDPDVLSMTEGSLRGRKLDSPHEQNIQAELKQNPELGDFLQASRPFTSRNPEQFINLKREGYGGYESEDSELAIALFTGKSDSIKELLKGADDAVKKSIVKLLEDKVVEKKNQGKAAIVFNILSVIEEVFPEIPEVKKTKIADVFSSHLAHTSQLANIKEFSAKGLLSVLTHASGPTDRNIIINEHVKPLETENELFMEYSEAYGENYKIVPVAAQKKVAESLQKAYQYVDDQGVSYVPDVLASLQEIGKYEGALGVYANTTLTDLLLNAVQQIEPTALNKNQKQNLEVIKSLFPFLKEAQIQKLFVYIHEVLHKKSWGQGPEELAVFVNELVLEDKVPEKLIFEVAKQYSDYINSPNIATTYYVNFLPAIKKLITDSPEAKQHFIEIFKTHAIGLDIPRLTTLFKGVEEQKISIREKLITPLVTRLIATIDAGERDQIIDILKMFGALQGGQLYISSLKDAVLEAKDFEITNHVLSKLEGSRPSLIDKDVNEIAPKLLEWGESLGADHPRHNTPYRFLVPSFKLLTNENKEKVIDIWSTILEKTGEPLARKNEICGFIQDPHVLNDFPSSRKDGFPRKLFDTARSVGLDEKETMLNTLAAIKSLYSRKTTFLKELKGYGTELEQQPEDSREHKLGKLFLEKLE
ncbi:MAG: P-loop NTPase fold protein [Minisyncoccia bacterium]